MLFSARTAARTAYRAGPRRNRLPRVARIPQQLRQYETNLAVGQLPPLRGASCCGANGFTGRFPLRFIRHHDVSLGRSQHQRHQHPSGRDYPCPSQRERPLHLRQRLFPHSNNRLECCGCSMLVFRTRIERIGRISESIRKLAFSLPSGSTINKVNRTNIGWRAENS